MNNTPFKSLQTFIATACCFMVGTFSYLFANTQEEMSPSHVVAVSHSNALPNA